MSTNRGCHDDMTNVATAARAATTDTLTANAANQPPRLAAAEPRVRGSARSTRHLPSGWLALPVSPVPPEISAVSGWRLADILTHRRSHANTGHPRPTGWSRNVVTRRHQTPSGDGEAFSRIQPVAARIRSALDLPAATNRGRTLVAAATGTHRSTPYELHGKLETPPLIIRNGYQSRQ